MVHVYGTTLSQKRLVHVYHTKQYQGTMVPLVLGHVYHATMVAWYFHTMVHVRTMVHVYHGTNGTYMLYVPWYTIGTCTNLVWCPMVHMVLVQQYQYRNLSSAVHYHWY